MQQARVRWTACMQHLRIEVAKVETLAATSLSGSRHRAVSRDAAHKLKLAHRISANLARCAASSRPLEFPPPADRDFFARSSAEARTRGRDPRTPLRRL